MMIVDCGIEKILLARGEELIGACLVKVMSVFDN